MIEVAWCGGLCVNHAGDIYALHRLVEICGGWEEARECVAFGRGLARSLESGCRALAWVSYIPSVTREVVRGVGGLGALDVLVVVSDPRSLPRELLRKVDVVTYVYAVKEDGKAVSSPADILFGEVVDMSRLKAVSIHRSGRRLVRYIPREPSYLGEYLEMFRGYEVNEILKELRRVVVLEQR